MSDFPMQYRTGQCNLGNHPLCTWTTCTCECHQPAQPAAEPLTPDAAWTEQQAASRAACLERWPEAEGMGYDPRCCRFPKSCSVEAAPVDTAPKLGFFQRAAARRLWKAADSKSLIDSLSTLGEEVGRIVVDQLLELAESLSETDPWTEPVRLAVERARLIDPAYTKQRWDETKEARR